LGALPRYLCTETPALPLPSHTSHRVRTVTSQKSPKLAQNLASTDGLTRSIPLPASIKTAQDEAALSRAIADNPLPSYLPSTSVILRGPDGRLLESDFPSYIKLRSTEPVPQPTSSAATRLDSPGACLLPGRGPARGCHINCKPSHKARRPAQDCSCAGRQTVRRIYLCCRTWFDHGQLYSQLVSP
jgi:hypothetical protein